MTLQALSPYREPCLTLDYASLLPSWDARSVLSSGLVQGLGQEAALEGSSLPRHLHDKGPPEPGEVAEFRQSLGLWERASGP